MRWEWNGRLFFFLMFTIDYNQNREIYQSLET